MTLKDIVHSDPEILGGTPVFVGTRVPVRTLLDYLEGGDPLEEFLESRRIYSCPASRKKRSALRRCYSKQRGWQGTLRRMRCIWRLPPYTEWKEREHPNRVVTLEPRRPEETGVAKK